MCSKYLLLLFISFSMISQPIISSKKILQNTELPSRTLLKIYPMSRLNFSSLSIELLKSLSAKLKDLHSQIYFHELLHISDHVTSCLVFLLSSGSNTLNDLTNLFRFLISSVAFIELSIAHALFSRGLQNRTKCSSSWQCQHLQIEALSTFPFFSLTFLLSIKIKILKCTI